MTNNTYVAKARYLWLYFLHEHITSQAIKYSRRKCNFRHYIDFPREGWGWRAERERGEEVIKASRFGVQVDLGRYFVTKVFTVCHSKRLTWSTSDTLHLSNKTLPKHFVDLNEIIKTDKPDVLVLRPKMISLSTFPKIQSALPFWTSSFYVWNSTSGFSLPRIYWVLCRLRACLNK